MKKSEYEALWRKNERGATVEKTVNPGDSIIVVDGKMAGTIGNVLSVDSGYVYARHSVTNVEFRCLIKDIEVK